MPLAHSYFSLKAEYGDLENVFKSTATFDHFYDLMLTYFFLMWKYFQKKTLVKYECTCISITPNTVACKAICVFAKLAEKSPEGTQEGWMFGRTFDFTTEFSIMKIFSEMLLGI